MLKIFYLLIIIELFLGGGGRLIEFGFMTLRMAFLGIVLLLMLVPEFWRKSPKDINSVFMLTLIFLLFNLSYLFFGLLGGSQFELALQDLRPILYFLAIPFFARILGKIYYVEITFQVLQLSSLALALFYIFTLVGLYFGLWTFSELYEKFSTTEEFMFRGSSGLFVYKGFLYLCIGLIFWIANKGRSNLFKSISIGIIFLAIFLTLTRGFLISTILSVVVFLILMRKYKIIYIFFGIAFTSILIMFGYIEIDGLGYLIRSDTDVSDVTRYQDLIYMIENTNLLSFFIGHGFGSVISADRLNIENAYLWIWWKMGIPGIFFWFIPLMLCIRYIRKIAFNSQYYYQAVAYFCGVLLVYIQSGANPYLTNPIGMSFVIIAIFSLKTISNLGLQRPT